MPVQLYYMCMHFVIQLCTFCHMVSLCYFFLTQISLGMNACIIVNICRDGLAYIVDKTICTQGSWATFLQLPLLKYCVDCDWQCYNALSELSLWSNVIYDVHKIQSTRILSNKSYVDVYALLRNFQMQMQFSYRRKSTLYQGEDTSQPSYHALSIFPLQGITTTFLPSYFNINFHSVPSLLFQRCFLHFLHGYSATLLHS